MESLRPMVRVADRVPALRLGALILVLSLVPILGWPIGLAPMTASAVIERSAIVRGKLVQGSYVERATWVGGGMQADDVTEMAADDYQTTEARGPFHSAWGRFHGQNWSQDENGIVSIQRDSTRAGYDDMQAVSIPVRSWRLDGLHDGSWVIEANRPSGERETRYYDERTFLLKQVVVASSDGYDHTWIYSNYRRVFGLMIPFNAIYGDGRLENQTTTTVTSFNPAKLSLDGIPQNKSLFDAPLEHSVTLPATFSDSGIIVHASIAEHPIDLLLDSGANGIYIDPGTAHRSEREPLLSDEGQIVRRIGTGAGTTRIREHGDESE